MSILRLILLAIHLSATAVSAGLPNLWEPQQVVDYFCQRWYHQSVVKNDTLFIHGGIQTFQIPDRGENWTNNTIGYNEFLLQVDLSESWDWKTNISYVALKQNKNQITGTSVRNGTVSGAMYHGPYSDPQIYTYAGTTFRGNESFPNAEANYYYVQYSDQYPMWSFDNETQLWDYYDIGQGWTPSYGASTEAPDQGLAFYLNGRTDNGSSSSTLWDGDEQTLLDGMIVIDMVQHSSRNLSTAGMKDYQPRIGGAMQYTPGVGENGVLVALGGQVFDGQRTTSSQDKGRLLNFDAVDVFDIASSLKDTANSGVWYSQETSGDIPPPRIDFCTVIASAPDNSSHNIYMYAGRDPTANETIFYDDIYVLSLPSFTWINVFQGKSPRFGHTCHIVGGRQLLTVGGHNKHPNKCDWEKKGVALLDLPTLGWGSVFHAGYSPYELSSNLTAALGGNSTGGATVQVPAKGWTSNELGRVVNTKRIYSSLDGTLELVRPNDSDSGLDPNTRIAVIAGVSVVGAVLAACIAWLVVVYRRRSRGRFAAHLQATPRMEMEGEHKFELSPEEKKIYEVTGTECLSEFPNSAVLAEADRYHGVTHAVELPATNFSANGRWGVPIIRVPSLAHLSRESSGSDTAFEEDSPDTPKKDDKDMV